MEFLGEIQDSFINIDIVKVKIDNVSAAMRILGRLGIQTSSSFV